MQFQIENSKVIMIGGNPIIFMHLGERNTTWKITFKAKGL